MTPKFAVPCVVLGGGASSRMRRDLGGDKARLAFGDKETLVQFQLHRLETLFERVYLSTKNAHEWSGQVDSSNIIEDAKNVGSVATHDLFAPTLGLFSALSSLDAQHILFVPVDAPFVDGIVTTKLLEAADADVDAVVARCGEKIHPTCAVYTKNSLPKIRDAIMRQHHKLTRLLDEMATIFVDFDSDAPFANLNDKAAYDAAQKEIRCR